MSSSLLLVMHSQDAALQLIKKCLNHPEPEVRAACLCALASKTSEVNPDYIKEGCRDVSPIVRSAAVHLLQGCPALWSECSASLSVLFNDPSLDVRYVSLRLAERMAHSAFCRGNRLRSRRGRPHESNVPLRGPKRCIGSNNRTSPAVKASLRAWTSALFGRASRCASRSGTSLGGLAPPELAKQGVRKSETKQALGSSSIDCRIGIFRELYT